MILRHYYKYINMFNTFAVTFPVLHYTVTVLALNSLSLTVNLLQLCIFFTHWSYIPLIECFS